MFRLAGVLALFALCSPWVVLGQEAVAGSKVAPEQIIGFSVERDFKLRADRFTVIVSTQRESSTPAREGAPSIWVTPYFWNEATNTALPFRLNDKVNVPLPLPANYLEKDVVELTATLDHAAFKLAEGNYHIIYKASLTAPKETVPYQIEASAVYELKIGNPPPAGGAGPGGLMADWAPYTPRTIYSAVKDASEASTGVVFDGQVEKEVVVQTVPVASIAPVLPPEDPERMRQRLEALRLLHDYAETKKQAEADPVRVAEELSFWVRKEEEKAAAQKEADENLKRLSKFTVKPIPRDYKVYFATNRPYFKMEKNPWDVYRFIPGMNPLYGPNDKGAYLGHCQIHFPGDARKRGTVEAGNGDTIRIEALSHFKESMKDLLDEIWTKDVIIYIHGYNVSFEAAVQTAAQFKEDIGFGGAVLVFSWPSYSLPGAYFEDQKMNEDPRTVTAAANVLSALLHGEPWATDRGKRGRRHLIAHSMGNRLALSAIESIIKNSKPEPKTKLSVVRDILHPTRFDQVVFAAPDVPRSRLLEVAAQIKKSDFAKGMTLYYSRKDIPVRLSEWVHLNNRAGARPVFVDGLDTINADAVNTRLGAYTFGHSYYAGDDRVLSDIGLIFRNGLSIESRMPPIHLYETVEGGHKHYAFTPRK